MSFYVSTPNNQAGVNSNLGQQSLFGGGQNTSFNGFGANTQAQSNQVLPQYQQQQQQQQQQQPQAFSQFSQLQQQQQQQSPIVLGPNAQTLPSRQGPASSTPYNGELKRSTSFLPTSKRRTDLSSIAANNQSFGGQEFGSNTPALHSHLRNELTRSDAPPSPGIVSNMSFITGYDGKPGSSFTGVNTERRKPTSTYSDQRLKRQPSYISDRENISISNLSSSRRSHIGGGSTKLRGEDLPPSTSMYDLARGQDRGFYSSGVDQSQQQKHIQHAASAAVTANTSTNQENGRRPQEAIVLDPYKHSIIVFGYPKELAKSVGKQFAKYGQIAEYLESIPEASKVLPGKYQQPEILIGPNWMKLTYEDTRSVSRALEENGKIFGRFYSIGVMKVTPEVLEEYTAAAKHFSSENGAGKENQSLFLDSISQMEPESMSFNMSAAGSKLEMSDRRKSILGNGISENASSSGIGGIPRTISMPHMNRDGDKTLRLNHSKIYPQKKRSRYIPSLSDIAQVPEQAGQSSSESAADKSWLKWTSKRARELVFGFDDI